MTVGEKIRQARKKAGLTQKQLGDAVGAAAVTIRQYEAGNREPNNTVLTRLAEALGLPNPAYFFFDPIPDEIEKSPAPDGGEAERDELIRILSVLDPSEREQLLAHGRTLVIAHEAQGTDPKSP